MNKGKKKVNLPKKESYDLERPNLTTIVKITGATITTIVIWVTITFLILKGHPIDLILAPLITTILIWKWVT